MRRRSLAPLFVLFAAAQTACSNTDEPPPKGPDDPVPEGVCAEEAEHDHPSLVDYSANLELSADDGVKVTLVRSEPAPPAVGDNVWTLDVTVNDAAPDDLSIEVKPSMPDHRHPTTVTPVVTNEGTGEFLVDPVHFQMAGFWETEINVTAGDAEGTVRFGFCVE